MPVASITFGLRTFVTCSLKRFCYARSRYTVNRLTRYWKYAVFGTLVPGVALAIAAAPKLVWNEYPDPFWKMVGALAGILCAIRGLLWIFLTIGTVGSDVTKLWKGSKVGAVLTFTTIALLARLLQRFTGRHFYGWYARCLVVLLYGATPWIVPVAQDLRCPHR